MTLLEFFDNLVEQIKTVDLTKAMQQHQDANTQKRQKNISEVPQRTQDACVKSVGDAFPEEEMETSTA